MSRRTTVSQQDVQLSFELFRQIVAEQLKVDEERVTRASSFINDLYADSIRMVELMLRLEEMGISTPAEAVWQMQTVGDAYDYYREHAGQLSGLQPGLAPAAPR
jgi:acyl carrier protein